MRPGDRFLFYHSNSVPPGIVGVGHVVKASLPDPTALDYESDQYEPKASPQHPIWFCAEVEYEEHLKTPMTLEQIRGFRELADMAVLKKAKRLSIVPVRETEFLFILKWCGIEMIPE